MPRHISHVRVKLVLLRSISSGIGPLYPQSIPKGLVLSQPLFCPPRHRYAIYLGYCYLYPCNIIVSMCDCKNQPCVGGCLFQMVMSVSGWCCFPLSRLSRFSISPGEVVINQPLPVRSRLYHYAAHNPGYFFLFLKYHCRSVRDLNKPCVGGGLVPLTM